MDLTLDRDVMAKGLQMVAGIVEPRQTLPILGNVLLQAEGDTLRLAATDLEIAAQVSVPATVKGVGSVTVPAKKFSEIVRELPSGPVTVKASETATVTLKAGGGLYRVNGLPPDDFPVLAQVDRAAGIDVSAAQLAAMLERVVFAVSHDESRFVLNGVLVTLHGTEMRCVATDGHRLAVASTTLESTASDVSGIVPRKAVGELLRALKTAETARVVLADGACSLILSNFLLTARLLEGQFPSWQAVIPKDQLHRIVVDAGALASAIRRVAVMAEERNRPVKLALSSGALCLSSADQGGQAEETVAVEYAGPEVTIGFNSRYLLDALRVIEGPAVFEFKDGQTPGVIRPEKDEGALCVVMPMRI